MHADRQRRGRDLAVDALGNYSGFKSASAGTGSAEEAPTGDNLGEAPGSGRPPAAGGADAEPTDDETYLRGSQGTNSEGIIEFLTVYPGWYSGRTVHIQAKVHLDNTTALSTQLFFDDAFTETVYAAAPYDEDTGRDTFNEDDSIIDESLLLTLSEEDGVLGVINFDVDRARSGRDSPPSLPGGGSEAGELRPRSRARAQPPATRPRVARGLVPWATWGARSSKPVAAGRRDHAGAKSAAVLGRPDPVELLPIGVQPQGSQPRRRPHGVGGHCDGVSPRREAGGALPIPLPIYVRRWAGTAGEGEDGGQHLSRLFVAGRDTRDTQTGVRNVVTPRSAHDLSGDGLWSNERPFGAGRLRPSRDRRPSVSIFG